MLIVQGPPEDMEAETEETVTELKAKAAEKAKKKAEAKSATEEAEAARRRGAVTWGMADDAVDSDGEEEGSDDKKLPDMSRNPFSVIKEGEGDAELNIKDPKTTLRNW